MLPMDIRRKNWNGIVAWVNGEPSTDVTADQIVDIKTTSTICLQFHLKFIWTKE